MGSTLNDTTLTWLVRDVVRAVEYGGTSAANVAAERLLGAGVQRDVHVGRDDLTARETLEWYAGQFLAIVADEQWFAMNSWLNCVDKFAPATPSEGGAA